MNEKERLKELSKRLGILLNEMDGANPEYEVITWI
jgi:hypothetical protein